MSLSEDQITAKNYKNFYDRLKQSINVTPSSMGKKPAGGGFIPVGTVLMVMRRFTAYWPSRDTIDYSCFFTCNGRTLDIALYPELSNYFLTVYGSINYFGGDGVKTFALPDLRGEFLCGSGTNSHAGQGSVGAAGIHRDSSEINTGWFNNASGGFSNENAPSSTYYRFFTKKQYSSHDLGTRTGYVGGTNLSLKSSSGDVVWYGVKPKNTSVNYIIAAYSHYINVQYDYSESEIVAGKWVDGKTLYQKTFIVNGVLTGDIEVGTLTGTDDHFISQGYVTLMGDVLEGASIPINSTAPIYGVTQPISAFIDDAGHVICSVGSTVVSKCTIMVRYTKL